MQKNPRINGWQILLENFGTSIEKLTLMSYDDLANMMHFSLGSNTIKEAAIIYTSALII